MQISYAVSHLCKLSQETICSGRTPQETCQISRAGTPAAPISYIKNKVYKRGERKENGTIRPRSLGHSPDHNKRSVRVLVYHPKVHPSRFPLIRGSLRW